MFRYVRDAGSSVEEIDATETIVMEKSADWFTRIHWTRHLRRQITLFILVYGVCMCVFFVWNEVKKNLFWNNTKMEKKFQPEFEEEKKNMKNSRKFSSKLFARFHQA